MTLIPLFMGWHNRIFCLSANVFRYRAYLWFEITVDNTMRPHELQRSEHLNCESPYQCRRESAKVVGLDQLVQVDTEQFGDNTEMTSEIEMIRHSNHVMLILWILSVRLPP
jgi:hypothetical protein